MKSNRFQVFVGVDQTGAAIADGLRARALPCVVLFELRRGLWKLVIGDAKGVLALKTLTPSGLEEVFARVGLSRDRIGEAALALDCVFGLPRPVWKPRGHAGNALWKLMRQTCASPHQESGFGRVAAEAFFSPLLTVKDGTFPQRVCEKYSGSNSVFQVHPYQRNIQTGTYRIWRDLASVGAERWFSLWPFDELDRRDMPWFFEGYPSHFWRSIFGFRQRSPERLGELLDTFPDGVHIQAEGLELAAKFPDTADAAVLALGALALQQRDRLFEPFEGFREVAEATSEGWILGVTP